MIRELVGMLLKLKFMLVVEAKVVVLLSAMTLKMQ
jgi:hypothetical protein